MRRKKTVPSSVPSRMPPWTWRLSRVVWFCFRSRICCTAYCPPPRHATASHCGSGCPRRLPQPPTPPPRPPRRRHRRRCACPSCDLIPTQSRRRRRRTETCVRAEPRLHTTTATSLRECHPTDDAGRIGATLANHSKEVDVIGRARRQVYSPRSACVPDPVPYLPTSRRISIALSDWNIGACGQVESHGQGRVLGVW